MSPPAPSPTPSTPLHEAWAEQARRRAAHRERKRRRRHRWMAGVALVVLVAVAGWVLFAADGGSPERSGAAGVTVDGGTAPLTTVEVTAVPPTTIAPGSVVDLEEVWLLDRQDGSFDWGLVVVSRDGGDREDIVVAARLVGADGEDLTSVGDEVGHLPAGSRVAVGGVVSGLPEFPQRIEAEVSIGRPVASAPGELVVRAVERRTDGDVVTGRLVSSLSTEVGPLRLGALWRDEAGAVVGSVFHDVGPVRPRVDARFEIPLADAAVPDGPPAEVLVAR